MSEVNIVNNNRKTVTSVRAVYHTRKNEDQMSASHLNQYPPRRFPV